MEKYYNNITKKMTEHPYRFKTRDEFVKEFGDSWLFEIGWFSYMDKYLGSDFLLDYEKDYVGYDDYEDTPFGYFIKDLDYNVNDKQPIGSNIKDDGYYWFINRGMIIKNQLFSDYNKPTKLVYERKILTFKKFNSK